MDTLTHIVLGAAVGEALMGKKVGKKAMLWGAIAANAPDIDAVVNFFVTDIDSLVMHRGITHSLFMAIIFGPLLGWMLSKAYKEKQFLTSWMWLITSNLILHDLLDTCTVYGTGLLTPFSNYRFSLDNIFVADPLYTLPLVISGIALLIIKSTDPSRYKWNRFGLIASSIYLVFTFYNHSSVVSALKSSMKEKGLASEKYFATPTLFNNLLWYAVVQDTSGFWVGYYSIFDKTQNLSLNFIPKNEQMLGRLADDAEINTLKNFTKGFYCLTVSDSALWFNDMRFGQIGGWEKPNAKFAFAFDLTEDADNSIVVQKGRMEGSTRKMFGSMWQRIKGN